MEWECKEIDKYIVLNKTIGKGNQATVYEAYRKDNLQIVAAKVFDLTQNGSTNQARNLQRQVKILTTLKHPYILECFDIKQTQKNTLKQQQLVFRDDLYKRSDAVKDLLSHILEKEEAKRYTWDQVASHKCLNAGSHYQNNPLLGSLEMNQVSGISSFNSDYKNVELKQQNEQKSSSIENPQTPNQQQNQSNVSIYKRRDNTNQLKQIHLLFRLLTQFALTYRIIWKGFFQLIVAQQQGQIYFKTDSIVNAIFLLMNSLLLKEHKFLRELLQNPKQFIAFRIQRNKLQNINEEDLTYYFNSEIYKSFMQNIAINFQQDTQVSLMNYSEMFQAQLIAAGFLNVITEDKCNEYIECSLKIINQNIQQMSQDAFNQENKTYITLLLYLFFLQKNEKRLQTFTNPLEHYQKLQKYMEDINFTSKQQIYDQIQQYIATDLAPRMDEEDDDDDDEEEEEDEQLSQLINKYT
ncbi:hypothetical protein ABPG72_021078 [Tetrahymena utriculariae]